jgi:ribosomal-protein-alanine N-acetyltransferase
MPETKQQIDSLKDSKSEEDRKKCIPLLQQYLQKHSDDAIAWYDLAGCFDFIGAEIEAEPCYKKAYDLGYEKLPEKEQAGFFVGYGSTLRNNLKFSESSEILQKSIEAFPNYPALDVFLAFTLYTQGKFKQAAETLFGAIIKIEGKPFDGYEKAIKWYCENLQTHPVSVGPPVIETERLIIRPLTDADVESVFEYCSNPEVAKFSTWSAHKNLDDSRFLISFAKKNYLRNIPEPYAITLKTNPQKVVGTVGWFWASEMNRHIEVAYALAENLWGQGLMVEAGQAVVNTAIKEHDINRISARCMVENNGSVRVMEKLGMKYEGTQRQAMFVKGGFVDLKIYAVSRSEWLG